MLSSILFGSQEKLTLNWKSLLQMRKIKNSQIQAEAAPLLLLWLYFSIFTVNWHEVPSFQWKLVLSQSKWSFKTRWGEKVQQLKGLLNMFWQSGSVRRARKALWNSVLFWILPWLPDLRKGSHCRKTSSDGWPKQKHLIKESKWKLLQIPSLS